MNNQLFHITNHWALGKNRKNLKAQVYFDDNSGINLFLRQKPIFAGKKYFCLPAKSILTVRFLPWKKTGFFHLLAKNCQPCFWWIKMYMYNLIMPVCSIGVNGVCGMKSVARVTIWADSTTTPADTAYSGINYRRTSRGVGVGGWGLQPPESGKIIFFRQSLNFSGRRQQPKWKFYFYFLNENIKFISSSEYPKSVFTNCCMDGVSREK